jgi:hypothetical protein
MASVTEQTFQIMLGGAKSRGITVQELLRAIIISDWIKQLGMSNLITTTQMTAPRVYAQSRDSRPTY